MNCNEWHICPFVMDIATIVSSIMSTIAVIVALYTLYSSKKDTDMKIKAYADNAQKQIDELNRVHKEQILEQKKMQVLNIRSQIANLEFEIQKAAVSEFAKKDECSILSHKISEISQKEEYDENEIKELKLEIEKLKRSAGVEHNQYLRYIYMQFDLMNLQRKIVNSES